MLAPIVALIVWTLALNHAAAGIHILHHGLAWAMTSRDPNERPDPTPQEGRAERARANHHENLAVFLALAVLMIVDGHGDDPIAVGAAWAFVAARVGHFVAYVSGVPPVRSLFHTVGLAVMTLYVLALLGVLQS